VQKVTLSPPIGVTISQANLPGYCQGENVRLTANATGSLAVSYLWSTHETTQTIEAANGTYTVTITNAWGCTSSASITVNVDYSGLSSAYVILVDEEVEFCGDKVYTGGVGAKGCHGEIEASCNTQITAAGTFAKARSIYKDCSSQITTRIYTPATVAWPAFQSMPYHAPNNSSISVPSYHTVTLTDTLYREIKVGKHATVIFTRPVVNIETSLRLDDYATVKFTGCTKVRIKGDLYANSYISINPTELGVIFYIGDNATFGATNLVNAVIYCQIGNSHYTDKCGIFSHESRIYIHDSRSDHPGIYKGMFIADEMYVHRYNNFYLETNCGICTSTSPKELEVGVTNPVQTNEAVVKNYPNPFSAKTNIVFTLPQNDKVRLEVYDLSGKLIQTLFNGDVSGEQEYKVEFDGSALTDGIYIYKMTTNDGVITGKMILNKE
jgi:hypothetical protein